MENTQEFDEEVYEDEPEYTDFTRTEPRADDLIHEFEMNFDDLGSCRNLFE